MGFWKIWVLFLGIVLIFGYFIVHGKFSNLSKKADELKQTEQEMMETLKEWKQSIFDQPAISTQATPDPAPNDDPPAETKTEDPAFACVMRVLDGKIGIFSPEGDLIRFLDVDVRTLPSSDLAILEAGISIRSRAELIERIEDFGG